VRRPAYFFARYSLAISALSFSSRYIGNPPDKPKYRKVEFSEKEVLREEVEIYGQPDHGCIEAC
jgi:hypothetical protein